MAQTVVKFFQTCSENWMLKHWDNLLNTDCIVVRVGTHTVYPIYRSGSTSLELSADKVYTNEQIKECDHIEVLIRDPHERFVSGINEYSRLNNVDVNQTWTLVKQGKLADRHFVPQYIWLLHLSKYYKGTVTLRPFEYIKNITDLHAKLDPKEKILVNPIENFVKVDRELMKIINQTVELKYLIRKYKDALS